MWLFRSQLLLVTVLLSPVLSANLWQTVKLWIFPQINTIPLPQQLCQDGACNVTNETFDNTLQTSENSSLAEKVDSISDDTLGASNVPLLNQTMILERDDINNKTTEEQETLTAEQKIESEWDNVESNYTDVHTVMLNTELSTIRNNNRSKRELATGDPYESSVENATINNIVEPLQANISIEILYNISNIEVTTEVNDIEENRMYQQIKNNTKLINNHKEENNTDTCELEDENNKYEKSLNLANELLEDRSFKEKLKVNSSLNIEGSSNNGVIEDQDEGEIIQNNDTDIFGGTFNESGSKLFFDSNNNKQTIPVKISQTSGLLNETNESTMTMTNGINCKLSKIQDGNKTIDSYTEKYSELEIKNDTPYDKKNLFLGLVKSTPIKNNFSIDRSSIDQSNTTFLKDNDFGKENVTTITEIGGNCKKSNGTTMDVKYDSKVNAISEFNIPSNTSQVSGWNMRSLTETNRDMKNATDITVDTTSDVGTTIRFTESNNNTQVEDTPATLETLGSLAL